MPRAAVRITSRWELYKLLAEPVRLRLLFLAGKEELSIGELAELLDEAQPNVSRHLSPLRRAGLLAVRKQGTRVFVRPDARWREDPVVNDALSTGQRLCEEDGTLSRLPGLLARRDEAGRAFFAQHEATDFALVPEELSAYVAALRPLLPRHGLAIDAGTGSGTLLDLLAPVFDRVVAIDREARRLAGAKERARVRCYDNVEFLESDVDALPLRKRIAEMGGADALFASRILHHMPKPQVGIRKLATLVRSGGYLLLIDYAAHQDDRMRENQADIWLGFSDDELVEYALGAGLVDPTVISIPSARCGAGPDGHLNWTVLAARVEQSNRIEGERYHD